VENNLMTVGEIAKKAGVSVRTLQYYDKSNLLKPSAQSEGGWRLYTSKDLVILHQILSLKYLGFSLDEIKKQLIWLDTPEEAISILENQKHKIKARSEELQDIQLAIEVLQEEITRNQKIDFNKYADIISRLQTKKESFWMIEFFDKELMKHIIKKFDSETGKEFLQIFQNCIEEIIQLKNSGKSPDSEEGQLAAKKWWDMVIDFTGGDMQLLPKIYDFYLTHDNWDKEWQDKWYSAEDFITSALGIYLNAQDIKFPL